MKTISDKKLLLFTIFVIGVLIGNIYTQINQNESISIFGNSEIVINKKIVPQIDEMPLKNGSSIVIEKIDGVKMLYMTLEDFEFVTKKKSQSKKLLKNLIALFKRME